MDVGNYGEFETVSLFDQEPIELSELRECEYMHNGILYHL